MIEELLPFNHLNLLTEGQDVVLSLYRLFTKIDEGEWIPWIRRESQLIELCDQRANVCRKCREDRMFADASVPVLAVCKIPLPPVHDCVPEVSIRRLDGLSDRVAFIEMIVEEPESGNTQPRSRAIVNDFFPEQAFQHRAIELFDDGQIRRSRVERHRWPLLDEACDGWRIYE